MLSPRKKLYFLLNRIAEKSEITLKGKAIVIDITNDLRKNFAPYEVEDYFAKLEQDEKVLKVINKRPRNRLAPTTSYPVLYDIQLLDAFDEYYLNIQNEPEYQEFTGKTPKKVASQLKHDLSVLHKEVFEKCNQLFESGAYAEAAEKSFKIVKDKLRDLTGHEKGSDAFGNTGLHIKGASASNVDHDFNQAVKFLTMAIDNFRNEKSHTSDAKIDDPQRAYEYLTLSSLAMNLLEQAEITN